jgi:hypothetical protein
MNHPFFLLDPLRQKMNDIYPSFIFLEYKKVSVSHHMDRYSSLIFRLNLWIYCGKVYSCQCGAVHAVSRVFLQQALVGQLSPLDLEIRLHVEISTVSNYTELQLYCCSLRLVAC